MAATLTGYGGVGEIGGNAFLLDDGRTRLLLDAGRRFGASATAEGWDAAFRRRPGFGDYFDAFLKARSFAAARDLLSLDLVPAIPTLYRADLGGQAGPAPVDAILLSHAHQDHFGLLGLVRHDIPIVASQQTLATLASLEATGAATWETDLVEVRLRGGVQWTQPRGGEPRLTVRWKYGDGERGPLRRFDTVAVTEQGDWTVESHPVDHSIQGATAFVLTRRDGYRVVYTGDFRMHGRNPALTERFLAAAADPDVLVMEGTNVRRGESGQHGHGEAPASATAGRDGARPRGEEEVEQQALAAIESYERRHGAGFVGVGYPMRDLDRLVSLWNVARRLGRRLALQPRQAHLLETLRRDCRREDLPDPRRDRNLAIFVRAREKGTVLRRGAPLLVGNKATLAIDTLHATPEQWIHLVASELDGWERDLVAEPDGSLRLDGHVATPADVARDPAGFLFTLTYWNMTDLFDIFPERERARGFYIHSQTQPFNDDLELTEFKLRRWLHAFHLGDPVGEPFRTHVSGHADEATLHEVLERLRPRTLVPVHSEFPAASKEWYEHRTGHRALLPRVGEALRLDGS